MKEIKKRHLNEEFYLTLEKYFLSALINELIKTSSNFTFYVVEDG